VPPTSWFEELDVSSLEGAGLGCAVVLIVVLALLLPAGKRGLARTPALFLGLHVIFRVLMAVLPDSGGRRVAAFAALAAILASIGRSLVLLALGVILGRRMSRPLPQVLTDIVQGLVYLVVLLIALRFTGVEPGSILMAGALLAVATALSLQETLGNMLAGLAIQLQHPFDIDDWIQFDADPKHVGRVTEINWRATRVVTLDDVVVLVPNAVLAKAPITNFTKPTPTSRRSVYVSVTATAPPQEVQKVILDAIAGSTGIVNDPPPSVVTNGFEGGNVEYWVRFFTDEFHKRELVDGAVRDRVWYALHRAGLSVAAPSRVVHVREPAEASLEKQKENEEAEARKRESALRAVDFLRILDDAQLRTLVKHSRRRLYAIGEHVVREGEASREMFVVEEGEVLVMQARATEQVIARLVPGRFFGEMALMTGEAKRVSARAATPCALILIDRNALKAIFEAAPHVLENMTRILAARRADQDGTGSDQDETPTVDERSSELLLRIRRFFAL